MFISMDQYRSPLPLPDEHMRLLGIIATHWEWVELILSKAVAEVMEHDPNRVAILTANIGFHDKCDIILAYARFLRETDPDEWTKFTTTLKTLRDAYAVRNKFIHAKWKLVNDSEIRRTEVRTRGGKFSIVDEPTPTTELSAAAQQIVDAGESFIALVQSYGILATQPRQE
jgi:hypothetical protein